MSLQGAVLAETFATQLTIEGSQPFVDSVDVNAKTLLTTKSLVANGALALSNLVMNQTLMLNQTRSLGKRLGTNATLECLIGFM